jgi:hypothetical protein
MRLIQGLLGVALPCFVLAACVPSPEPTPTPAPAPAPTPTPTPVATPSPVPSFANWIDAPQTPGDWSYQAGVATFGQYSGGAQLTLRCDRAAGAVDVIRAGTSAAPAQMIIRTEFAERGVNAQPTESDPPMVIARLPARDPLLDAMAFSKGRFAVEVSGLPAIYVPSYPEVTRVIEDCR